MNSIGFGRIAVWTGALALLAAGAARAQDKAPQNVLKNQGLREAGPLYVLELETDLPKKLNDARRLAGQVRLARMQLTGTASAKDREEAVRNLTDQVQGYRMQLGAINQQINAANQQINAANQQMNSVQLGGRFGTGYNYNYNRGVFSGVSSDEYQEALAYRNQLQMELGQATTLLNQLRTQEFDPEARKKADAELKRHRAVFHQALLDLRKQVDSIKEKYAEVTKNAEVQKALATLARRAPTKPKLGPSPQFLANVKALERLEKEDADGAVSSAPDKGTRPSRKSARSRRTTRLAPDSDVVSDSPF
jgi:hypothetical protein